MEKLDLKKENKAFYSPSAMKPAIVEVPKFQFLMIDGYGAPGCDDFQKAVQALFGVSYKIKFASKKGLGNDYVVMPLEGLWWADDMEDFVKGNRERWRWTLMMLQPDFVTLEMIRAAIGAHTREEAEENGAFFKMLRLESYKEGPAAQIIHIGPFSEEHANIMKLHELIAAQGGKFDGKVHKHHEIYLSDFRKVTPEKLKTVLRQPFGR